MWCIPYDQTMETIASSPNNLTYAICYGLFCGPLHGHDLRAHMKKAGFQFVSDPLRADIVICHSAGCWLVPTTARPSLLVYVAPVMTQPSVGTWLKAIYLNDLVFLKEHRVYKGITILAINLWYVMLEPLRNIGIFRRAPSAVIPGAQGRVLVITNRYDPWQQPAGLQKYLTYRRWNFINLNGSHDNLWVNPAPYVAIMQIYAKQLLATADR